VTEFQCKVSDLVELCQTVSLKGRDLKGKEHLAIPDFLLTVNPENLEVKAVDSKGALAVNLTYKIKAIIPGIIPIGDVEKLLEYLSRYNSSDDITVSTTENKLVITRKTPLKVSRIPLASLETITTSKGADAILQNFQPTPTGYFASKKTTWNLKLTLKAEDVSEVIEDGEVVKQRIYPWKLDNGLTINVGTEQLGEIETSIPIKEMSGDIPEPSLVRTKTSFAYGIDNIFSNLSGDVKVFLVNGVDSCPIILQKTTDKYNLTIFLAPAVITE